MKKILGLDLGTNSIGWALIEQEFDNKKGRILGLGTRVIPMSQDILGDFGKGNSISQTAERTRLRSTRRLRERHLLRRERLHRILNILGFLPEHYSSKIDFQKRYGKFIADSEPKLAYCPVWNERRKKNDYEFLFKNSFNEMLNEFRFYHSNNLINESGGSLLIPYDWTIYYLRKKALSQKIEKEELAWLLLNFNQKRGYYQLRGEDTEEIPNKLVEFHSLKIIDVTTERLEKSNSEAWYSLKLENGWIYRRSSKTSLLDWKGKVRDFIVTTDLNEDGSVKKDKEGNEKRSFRSPGDDDWTLLKKKTEQEIDKSHKTVGTYIYDSLLQDPKQKIKGKLVRTIERKFYKEELKKILKKQKEFHPELQNKNLLNDCIRELYRNNDSHQFVLSKKDIVHLLIEDLIFYQRPLRSQKSSISNCTLEFRKYKNVDGVEVTQSIKSVPKSNPYYQEFRIWQWISNLSIHKRDDDSNISTEFIESFEDIENIFNFLNLRKEIDQKSLIKFLLEKKGFAGKFLNAEVEKYRWNYVEDKKYPCNETRILLLSKLDKAGITEDFFTREREQQLWHIIYSVTDRFEYEKALGRFAEKYQLNKSDFIDSYKKFPPFKREYGSFSEKAIKKLLPLLRTGNRWTWNEIDENTKSRIDKLLTGEYDSDIPDRVREKTIHLKNAKHFQGLPLWLAQYIVYGRHSEASIVGKWNSVEDLERHLKEFKQHSLRNPIVEQLVTETIRVVKDIWVKYGKGSKDYFTEIHIELGRDMKNNAEERRRISNKIAENENTNLRIKALLAEMVHDGTIENVRPYSPMQQEILKIYEDGVLNSGIEVQDDILKISKTAQPSANDLKKYKLWLEQKYRSPYTGEVIPLSKLFTPEYEIEHIIPQSRYFDDSFNNKVICESAVNKLKDNQIGLAFIKNFHGQIIECGNGKKIKIFEVDAYENFVKKHYENNRSKRNKLLMEDIPDQMIERQLNDTRYISKFISNVLSNLVRTEINDDGINSKNIISGNGKITSQLKQDWGLNDIWTELILPRFERMNKLTNSTAFTSWNENHQKFLPTVPLEYSKGFSKKRIDHRHHAMDALVIACATRDHINLLNNKHAKSKERYDLNRKLKKVEKVEYNHPQTGERVKKEIPKQFLKPWHTFSTDTKNALEEIIISFKQNLRVINKSSNHYESWVKKEGKMTKEYVRQEKGDNWAIRKPMHKDTVSGLIKLRKKKTVSISAALDNFNDIVNKSFRNEIINYFKIGLDKKDLLKKFKLEEYKWNNEDISKLDIYYWLEDNVASRVPLNDSFDESRILNSVSDTGIQKILLNHLKCYKGRLDEKGKEIPAHLLAFSPEGIEEMNKNIKSLNNGKNHQPIIKVRTYEPKGNKFQVGQLGNKKSKFVEAAKGTNLFFGIFINKDGNRKYETVPLNIVIERQKQGLAPVPAENENGDTLLFHLSPNDLVYVPSDEEIEIVKNMPFASLKKEQINNIYKVVSFTGNQIFFIKHDIAASIVNKKEFSTLNKMERSIDGRMIKETCIKMSVNRIGVIQSHLELNFPPAYFQQFAKKLDEPQPKFSNKNK